jgi:hypothetical protein
MKIVFVLPSPYPTKKAYGITIRETALAAKELGFSVITVSGSATYNDENFRAAKLKSIYLSKNIGVKILLKIAQISSTLLSKICWLAFQHFIIANNRNLIKEQNADILWCRDERTALLLQKYYPTKKIVVELHLRPKNNKLRKLIKKSRKGMLVLAPINEYIYDLIDHNIEREFLVIGFTGVKKTTISSDGQLEEFIKRFKERIESHQLKVGYFGKFYPGGYSKGMEDLLDLANLNKSAQQALDISIIGGGDDDVKIVKLQAKNLNLGSADIKILGHQPQEILFDLMRESDFIILPKPENENYSGRPLKTLEACAIGRITVAAKCKTNSRIFNGKFQPFWYQSGDAESLLEAINLATIDEDLFVKIKHGTDLASKYTWKSRVIKIIKALEENYSVNQLID